MYPQTIANLHTLVYTVGRLTPEGYQMLGTCFLLNKAGLFATAAHVLGGDDRNLLISTSPQTNLSIYQDTAFKQVQTVEASIHAIDTFRDICVLKINDHAITNLNIGGSDDVSVGDELAVIGYPHCTDNIRRVLTYQKSHVGAKILIDAGGINSKYLVLNIQTRPGQSGSPVLRDSDARLIGMLIGAYSAGTVATFGGVDPSTLHQTTHVISAEYILDMI